MALLCTVQHFPKCLPPFVHNSGIWRSFLAFLKEPIGCPLHFWCFVGIHTLNRAMWSHFWAPLVSFFVFHLLISWVYCAAYFSFALSASSFPLFLLTPPSLSWSIPETWSHPYLSSRVEEEVRDPLPPSLRKRRGGVRGDTCIVLCSQTSWLLCFFCFVHPLVRLPCWVGCSAAPFAEFPDSWPTSSINCFPDLQ